MKILTVANQKGGVGKSTLVCQLAYYLVLSGLRVLVLEFDHQCHASKPLRKSYKALLKGFKTTDIFNGLAEESFCFTGTLIVSEFTLVAGDDRLCLLESQKDNHNSFIKRLSGFLYRASSQFDVCLIDTNPNPDIRYTAALSLSTHVICPIQLNQESLDGINGFMNHPYFGLKNIKQKLNKNLQFIGVLPSMVQGNPFQKDNFAQLKRDLKHMLIPANNDMGIAYTPHSVAFPVAQQAGLFIGDMKKSSARKAWHITRQSFNAIAKAMKLEV